ncbi:tetratricopeptide repeat protein [Crossiella sp. SN42]|uniref:tetratricopeptide repeat protein n=1 Tax=Crossiella sp. SN42 TaxID=2944808 RepID=UPI00207C459A|nr:tetratricopeptide repeat protein [Crossiella sp. SN42]MCO1580985.1 tetratricopeptide repeat protein [Crossiella sp. SN42]
MTEEPEALCRQAAAYLANNKPKRALHAAERATELAPDAEAPHRLRGIALTELGRHAEAVAAAREAVRLAPGDWRGQVALAEALGAGGAMLDPQRPEGHQAVAAARRAVELAPAEPRCFEVLGDIALRATRWDITEQAYLAALRLDPGNKHAKLNLDLVRKSAKNARPTGRPGEPGAGSRAGAGPAPGAGPAAGTAPGTAHRPQTRAGSAGDGQLPTGEPPPPPADAVARLLWPTARTLTLVLSLGSLALVIAGLPQPGPGHVWLGVLLLAATAVLAALPLRRLPATVRPRLVRILAGRPRLGLTTLLLGFGTLCLLAWTAISLFQPGDIQLPVLTCLSTAVAAVLARLRRG